MVEVAPNVDLALDSDGLGCQKSAWMLAERDTGPQSMVPSKSLELEPDLLIQVVRSPCTPCVSFASLTLLTTAWVGVSGSPVEQRYLLFSLGSMTLMKKAIWVMHWISPYHA